MIRRIHRPAGSLFSAVDGRVRAIGAEGPFDRVVRAVPASSRAAGTEGAVVRIRPLASLATRSPARIGESGCNCPRREESVRYSHRSVTTFQPLP